LEYDHAIAAAIPPMVLPTRRIRAACCLVLLLLRAGPTFGRAEEVRAEKAERSGNNSTTTTIRFETVEKEISTAQCVLAVGSSDRNDDQQVDRSEFNQVILEVLSGCTIHEETVRDWDEIFRTLACLCREYDDDVSCCDETAKRAQYGAVQVVLRPGQYPNEYTYRVCDLLQAAVIAQCFVQVGGGPVVSAPTIGATPFPTRAPSSSNDTTRADDSSRDNDTLYRNIINLVVLLIVLIILLLCMTICYMRYRHLRRINNDDEYDDNNDDDDDNDDDDRGRRRRHRRHRRPAATDDNIDEDSQQAFANTVAKGTFLTTGVDGSEVLLDIETGSRVSSASSSVDPHNNSSGFPIVEDDDDEDILPSGMIPEGAEGDSETERVVHDNSSSNNKHDEPLQLVLPQDTSLTDLLPPAFLPTSSNHPINNNTITSIEENESGWDDVVDNSSSATTTSSNDPQYVGDVDMSADENDGDISSAGGGGAESATDDERDIVVVTDQKNETDGK
jgi:hypothetical protein